MKGSPRCSLCEIVLPLLSLAAAVIGPTRGADIVPTCQRLASPHCRCNDIPSPPDVSCTLQAGATSIFKVGSGERLSIGTLDLSGSDLSRVKAGLLDGVGSVHTLRAWGCGLRRLPRALLRVPSLRVLDLSHNNLTTLPLAAMARVAVSTLLASHNNLTAVTAEGQLAGSLVELDLSHNGLTSFPSYPLWQNARKVDMSHNALTHLPVLSHTSTLKELDLSGNSISRFPAQFLSYTPFLQKLSLAGNGLKDWQPGNEQVTLNDLQHLDLSNNQIRRLSYDADDLTLPFAGADPTPHWLAPVPPLPFGAIHLQSLNLSHNALSPLHPAVFRAFGQLRQLDLSHNPLLGQEVTSEHVSSHLGLPQHLTLLDLSHCSFGDLDYCQLWHLHDLLHLHLDHNPLRCTCQLYALHHAHRWVDR